MNSFLAEPLNSSHNKAEFDCGNDMLNQYLQKQAKQDVKRKLSACFVLSANQKIKGYYTLSNAGIARDILPEEIKKRLPYSYESLPVTLLGRLAISSLHQGQGIGRILLIDALKRSNSVSKHIGSMAVIVDPIDLAAQNFYSKFQFIKLPDSEKMFLPMKTVELLFEKK